MAVPIWVSVPPVPAVREALSALAMPKSVTTAVPPESRTLSGLMSRCTIPRAWAYASALVTSRRIASTSPMGSPLPSRRLRSDSPSTYGMVNQGRPSTSPAASTGTMLACCREAASRISRSNRWALSPCTSSGFRTLMTTLRESRASWATNTRDIPPPPSSRSMAKAVPRLACNWDRRSMGVLVGLGDSAEGTAGGKLRLQGGLRQRRVGGARGCGRPRPPPLSRWS